jgi:hypothetical protein
LIISTDIDGSLNAMAEQLCNVLVQVVLTVISDQPAHLPPIAGTDLNHVVRGVGHGHLPTPGSSMALKENIVSSDLWKTES